MGRGYGGGNQRDGQREEESAAGGRGISRRAGEFEARYAWERTLFIVMWQSALSPQKVGRVRLGP